MHARGPTRVLIAADAAAVHGEGRVYIYHNAAAAVFSAVLLAVRDAAVFRVHISALAVTERERPVVGGNNDRLFVRLHRDAVPVEAERDIAVDDERHVELDIAVQIIRAGAEGVAFSGRRIAVQLFIVRIVAQHVKSHVVPVRAVVICRVGAGRAAADRVQVQLSVDQPQRISHTRDAVGVARIGGKLRHAHLSARRDARQRGIRTGLQRLAARHADGPIAGERAGDRNGLVLGQIDIVGCAVLALHIHAVFQRAVLPVAMDRRVAGQVDGGGIPPALGVPDIHASTIAARVVSGDRAAQVERAVVHIHAAALDGAVAADLRAAVHRERDIAVAHLVHIHAAAVSGRRVAADLRAAVHRECGAAA